MLETRIVVVVGIFVEVEARIASVLLTVRAFVAVTSIIFSVVEGAEVEDAEASCVAWMVTGVAEVLDARMDCVVLLVSACEAESSTIRIVDDDGTVVDGDADSVV